VVLSSGVKAKAAAMVLMAGGRPLTAGVGQGWHLHAFEGRGGRVLAAVLPLPGVKPVCRMGQHYFCREGSPEGGLVVVGRLSLSKGTVLGPKLLCDAVSSRGLKRLAAWPARAVLVDCPGAGGRAQQQRQQQQRERGLTSRSASTERRARVLLRSCSVEGDFHDR